MNIIDLAEAVHSGPQGPSIAHALTSSDSAGPPGTIVREHRLRVPLDHGDPRGEQIEIFAREFTHSRHGARADSLPWLVYFNGGPGMDGYRPLDTKGWFGRLLEEFRIVVLDQRGTGLSTPVDAAVVAGRGSPAAQFDFLRHFRQDSIVRDAELLRHALLGGRPWHACGQSYGGWCITTYLSQAPEGLASAIITGGLPPVGRSAEEVYRQTYKTVVRKNDAFYERFPRHVEHVRGIADFLLSSDVRLPNGDPLSLRRFQQLGLMFYRANGPVALNYLLEGAWAPGERGRRLSNRFLQAVQATSPFESQPLFAVLHEPIFAENAATRWAAERVRGEHPEFATDRAGRVLFTGEMIYPWMFDDYAALRPFREVAELIAAHDGWPPLYDAARLARTEIPVAAVVYWDDMCVVREYSLDTGRLIRGAKVWITNEFEHDGKGVDGERIMGQLLAMVRGESSPAF